MITDLRRCGPGSHRGQLGCTPSLVLCAMTVAVGCGSSLSRPGQGGTGGAGAPASSGWPGPVTVPVRPLSEGLLEPFNGVDSPVYSAQIDYQTSPTTIVWQRPIALAVGAGYPDVYTAVVSPNQLVDCGGFTGAVKLHEALGGNAAVSATVMGDARVVLSISGAGEVPLIMTGEIEVVAGTPCVAAGTHPFELHLTVTAFVPTATSFVVPPSCASASVRRVAPGRRMKDIDSYVSHPKVTPMFAAVPVGPTGTPVVVANADPRAQVSIRVDGPPRSTGAPTEPPFSLDVLDFPNVPGPVTFTPAGGGPPLVVEVVAPRQIDRMDLEIQLAGCAGGPTNLRDQAAYSSDNWSRRCNRIEPRVSGAFVGSDRLCSAPAYSWFTFATMTPAVCPTMPDQPAPFERAQFDGISVGQSGRFIADGTCNLSLRAPELLGGYEKNLTFTVSDLASLLPY